MNLAVVNRPQDLEEFLEGNFGFATVMLNTLKMYHNTYPGMISSSNQATLGEIVDIICECAKAA